MAPVPRTVGSCPCGSCRIPCFERPAGCPEHGTHCEPEDHAEPPTVGNEVV
ncbi:hypothetical protein [Streptomyces griseomycini]|uniref:Uncharacterized protein n=1 Tax=Streptomyces griseomycini TaxID=66895 RepID=A0A7W7VA49_9ACTN|nr:hypothetical protein [Streptomyces griseomycini]MBB4902579.1 hypothetical protein [Streptomyces griseomycini]GGR54286.1 hypothetical protein GCM10015536_69500 [Streptomyces griseomycini]